MRFFQFLRSTVSILTLLSVAPLAFSQGGAGGAFGGGGGFGGGMGGGMQGGQGGQFVGTGETITRQLFLSPGDRTEWEFEAKENETVLIRVESSVFDPAVAVHDETGKLVENDDIEPGNQMAQLVFAATKPGKYKAVVTNYKGTAGGAFEFVARRFHSVPMKFGQPQKLEHDGKTAWGRVKIDAPGEYTIAVRGGSNGIGLLRPNGERMGAANTLYQPNLTRHRISVEQPGEYYFDVPGPKRPTVRVTPITVGKVKDLSTIRAVVEEEEIADWQLPIKKNDIIEVTLQGDGKPVDPGEMELELRSSQRHSDGRPFYTSLTRAGSKFIAIAQSDGYLKFSLRHRRGVRTPYALSFANVGKPFPNAPEVAGRLDWFGTDLWTFDALPGDIVRLSGASKTYLVNLGVTNPVGGSVYGQHVGGKPEAVSNLLIEEGGRYVVQVSGGGIGDYRLVREVVKPKRLPEGTSTGKLHPTEGDVWRFAGKKGQDFVLRLSGTSGRTTLAVRAPNGNTITSGATTEEPEGLLLRVKIPEDGEFTVVLGSGDGIGGEYTIRLVNLDK